MGGGKWWGTGKLAEPPLITSRPCACLTTVAGTSSHPTCPPSYPSPRTQHQANDGRSATDGGSSSSGAAMQRELLALELCLYCQQPCEVGLFAVEPVWCCSCW